MGKKALPHGFFTGTKALVMGIGLHGGGVATARWLATHGARVTATDMRTKAALAHSLRALRGVKVRYVLGEHRKKDFLDTDLVVVNPGVPRESEYIQKARKNGVRIENDASLFFRFTANTIIGVTGTRGKTTTTLWIAELLKKKYPRVRPSGNTPDNALLKEFERVNKKKIPVVAELSSWQLEYLPQSGRAPHVAVITNIHPDHLNRYHGIHDYANAKAGIFTSQTSLDALVLNHDNSWHKYFERKDPKSARYYVSKKALPKELNGLFVRAGKLVFRKDRKETLLFSVARFTRERGEHNLENLMSAVLAVRLFEPAIAVSERDALELPTPPMRQEVIYRKGKLTIVNDSCATSPDGTIAAIRRFSKYGKIVLIVGGTDKDLKFRELSRVITKNLTTEQVILLDGSATTKLAGELKVHWSKIKIFKTLKQCVDEAFGVARSSKGRTIILFSPGAASFEKFLHEFDRGEQFAALIRAALKK